MNREERAHALIMFCFQPDKRFATSSVLRILVSAGYPRAEATSALYSIFWLRKKLLTIDPRWKGEAIWKLYKKPEFPNPHRALWQGTTLLGHGSDTNHFAHTVLAYDLCAYCGAKGESFDHIVAKTKGGKFSWENLTTACRFCNSCKGETSLLLFLRNRDMRR